MNLLDTIQLIVHACVNMEVCTSFFAGLFVFKQDYTKATEQVFQGQGRIHDIVGVDPDNRVDPYSFMT